MFFLCIHEELALFSFPEEQKASVGTVSYEQGSSLLEGFVCEWGTSGFAAPPASPSANACYF